MPKHQLPHPKGNRPSSEDVVRMWNELSASAAPFDSTAFHSSLAQLKACYANGDARFLRFSISHSQVLEWFAFRNNLYSIDFVRRIILLQPVLTILEQSGIGTPDVSNLILQQSSAFTLDGELAEILCTGGAYPNTAFQGTDKDAKAFGLNLCSLLFDERYSDVSIMRSFERWSPWFIDDNGIWNRSWFGFDRSTFHFWMLLLTDTD